MNHTILHLTTIICTLIFAHPIITLTILANSTENVFSVDYTPLACLFSNLRGKQLDYSPLALPFRSALNSAAIRSEDERCNKVVPEQAFRFGILLKQPTVRFGDVSVHALLRTFLIWFVSVSGSGACDRSGNAGLCFR